MKIELSKLIQHIFEKGLLIKAIFSNPSKNVPDTLTKVEIRPIQLKQRLLYQVSEQVKNKILHRNIDSDACQKSLLKDWLSSFKQGMLFTSEGDFHLLTNKKGETTIIKKPASLPLPTLVHNRPKTYLLEEGVPLPFLIQLGLMNTQGKVLPQKRDKFKQINRFLEMISDLLPNLNLDKPLHILDFGCGKAYLTFSLHHFLKVVKGIDVHITGLDLKEDVISFCQDLAQNLNYLNMNFLVGDITAYMPTQQVDMVVALHACDTATDAALAKAVQWGAKVIVAAPCCQHELYNQLSSENLEAVLMHGILRERFASLVTDAARAQILEMMGYKTQIIEFIDSEHTPKNLMIRAVFGNSEQRRKLAKKHFLEMKEALHISPILERICNSK